MSLSHLITARSLIASPDNWTTTWYATSNREPCTISQSLGLNDTRPPPDRFCLMGAIYRAHLLEMPRDSTIYDVSPATLALDLKLLGLTISEIHYLNEVQGHSAVLKALDTAIQRTTTAATPTAQIQEPSHHA